MGNAEGAVDFLGVEGLVERVEGDLGVWLETRAGDGYGGQGCGGQGASEEWEEAWEGGDGRHGEVGPGAEVADVPPEIPLTRALAGVDVELTHEMWGWVGSGEVVEHRDR